MPMALEIFISYVMELLVSIDIGFEVVSVILAGVLQFQHFFICFRGYVIRIVGTEKMVA
jgi:hypothetical protein